MLPHLVHRFAAVAGRPDPESDLPDLSDLRSTIDGQETPVDRIAAALERHGLAGAAYRLLEADRPAQGFEGREPQPHVPLSVALRPRFLVSHARTLAHLDVLEAAGEAFRVAEIPLLITQGAALLARGIYVSAEQRPMSDADALVPPGAWPGVHDILAGAGFVRLPDGRRWLRGGGILDLHTAPLGMERITARRAALPLDAELVWNRSEALGYGNSGVMALVPTRPMLYVLGLAHLQKHSFSSLMWFVDLARLGAFMSPEERDEARSLLERLRLQAAAAVMSGVAGGVWGLRPADPLELNVTACEPGSRALVSAVIGNVAALRDTGIAGERLLWRMAPDRLSRFRLIWESAFPSGEVMREIYPGYRATLRGLFMIRRVLDLVLRQIKARVARS
jgi:hypothetical protein